MFVGSVEVFQVHVVTWKALLDDLNCVRIAFREFADTTPLARKNGAAPGKTRRTLVWRVPALT